MASMDIRLSHTEFARSPAELTRDHPDSEDGRPVFLWHDHPYTPDEEVEFFFTYKGEEDIACATAAEIVNEWARRHQPLSDDAEDLVHAFVSWDLVDEVGAKPIGEVVADVVAMEGGHVEGGSEDDSDELYEVAWNELPWE
jgi:hypothetical protein